MKNKLTAKEEKYVQGLFSGLSQRKAYKQAFDASNMQDNTIDVKACELSKTEKISVRLAELQNLVASKNIASEIEIQEFWSESLRNVNNELKDRLKASELLGKSKKMFTEKIEHSGNIGIQIIDDIADDPDE